MKTLKNILICIILPITLFLTASITADDTQVADTAVSAVVTSDTDVNTVTLPVSDTAVGTDVVLADIVTAAEMPGNLGLYQIGRASCRERV